PISFSPASLPPAVVGQPYNQTITAAGGAATLGLTFVLSAPLPPGLSAAVSGATLTISGTPTGPGAIDVSLTADDRADANGEPLVNVWSLDGRSQRSPNVMAFEHGFHGGVRVAVGDLDG